jgi:hypothetical protein
VSEDAVEPSHSPREPGIAEPDWIASRMAIVIGDMPVSARTAALLQTEMRGPLGERRLSSGGLAALAEQLLKSLGED